MPSYGSKKDSNRHAGESARAHFTSPHASQQQSRSQAGDTCPEQLDRGWPVDHSSGPPSSELLVVLCSCFAGCSVVVRSISSSLAGSDTCRCDPTGMMDGLNRTHSRHTCLCQVRLTEEALSRTGAPRANLWCSQPQRQQRGRLCQRSADCRGQQSRQRSKAFDIAYARAAASVCSGCTAMRQDRAYGNPAALATGNNIEAWPAGAP